MAAKSDYLHVRISPEVKDILTAKASRLGMTMSEYVRLLILEDAMTTTFSVILSAKAIWTTCSLANQNIIVHSAIGKSNILLAISATNPKPHS